MNSVTKLLSRTGPNCYHLQRIRLYCSHDVPIRSFTAFSRNMKTNIKPFEDGSPWTYSKNVHFYSTLRQSVISDVTQSINIEKLQEESRRHALMTGSKIHVKDLVEKELDFKFHQTIEHFTEKEKRALKIIQLEHSFLFSEGYAIPSPEEMTNRNWLEAMTLATMEDRLRYYVEVEDLREKSEENTRVSPSLTSDGTWEADNPQCMFFDAVNPELEIRLGNYRLASALQFGVPLVIDMNYADINSSVELVPLSQQLWDMYCANRSHPDPFHLVFTNCCESNPIYRHLILHHTVETSFVLATFTEKSHLDLFPQHDLIYLSSQSNKCLGKFNPNTVYILGAYYDRLVRKKAASTTARQEKIKCRRLPIDENVRWRHQASKDLDMDHMVNVLLSVKAKQSWKDAFISKIPMLINQKS